MSRDVMKLALEALEPLVRRAAPYGELDWLNGCKAITALREALAEQPAQYGWTTERIAGMARLKEAQDKKLSQRTWVGLTDEERGQIINANFGAGLWSMAKDIEAKLRSKNENSD